MYDADRDCNTATLEHLLNSSVEPGALHQRLLPQKLGILMGWQVMTVDVEQAIVD